MLEFKFEKSRLTYGKDKGKEKESKKIVASKEQAKCKLKPLMSGKNVKYLLHFA